MGLAIRCGSIRLIGSIHGLDRWQSWSDRNFAQLQSIILGIVALFAYSAGVIVAAGHWAVIWAATVLFIAGIDQVDRYMFYAVPVVIAAASPIARRQVSVLDLEVFDTFATAILGVNTAALADYELLAASTY